MVEPLGLETEFRVGPAGLEAELSVGPFALETEFSEGPAGGYVSFTVLKPELEAEFNVGPLGLETEFNEGPAGAEASFEPDAAVVVPLADAWAATAAFCNADVRLVIKSLSEKAGAPTVEVDAGVGPAVDAEFVVVDEFVDVADVGVGAELLLFCNAICWSKLCKSDALVDAPTLLIVIPLTSQKGSLQVSVRAFSQLG